MTPLWRPLLAASVATFFGAAIDRAHPLAPRGSALRVPIFMLGAFLGCYLAAALPVLAALLAAALLSAKLARTDARPTDKSLGPRTGDRRPLAWTVAAFAAVMLAWRPSTPRFWDAFVWLAKARFAAGGISTFVAGALHSKASPFIPEGYPLFEPMTVGIMGCFSAEPRAVVAGAIGFELMACALFLSSLVEAPPRANGNGTRLVVVAFVLLTSPLVFVHLRSSYVDLPLGFMIGALATLLARPGTGTACAILAMAAAASKDEGLIHVVAIVLVAVTRGLLARDREGQKLATRALFAGISAAAVTGAWHVRLAQAGVVNTDHALTLPDWHRVAVLLPLLLTHLTDVRSWGGLWALTLGGMLALLGRPKTAPCTARWLGASLACQATAVGIGLLATPERVMEFAAGGTLLNRLAMQLAPTAALFLASWLMPEPTHYSATAMSSTLTRQ